MVRGKVYIVPDEKQILADLFQCETENDGDQLKAMQEFCDQYQIESNFENKGDYNASCYIAKLGHMLIKTDKLEKKIVFYLPNRVTDHQAIWFEQQYMQLDNYSLIECFNIQEEENKVNEVNGKVEIRKQIIYKNILYNLEKGESQNVRQKI